MSKKVIHYDTGQFHVMSISGRHIICLCGKWFQGNYEQDTNRYTTEKEKVTCKNCLNKLTKGSQQMRICDRYQIKCACDGHISWGVSAKGKLIGHCDSCKQWIFPAMSRSNDIKKQLHMSFWQRLVFLFKGVK